SQFALGLFCKSYIRKLDTILNSAHVQLTPKQRDLYEPLRRAMDTGVIVTLGASTSQFLNTLQVHRSSRFLYAATDEFELANQIRSHPQKAEIFFCKKRVGFHGVPSRPNEKCLVI